MLRGDGERVEEHQEDHEPIEDIGLDCSATLSSAEPIPPAPVAAGKGQARREDGGEVAMKFKSLAIRKVALQLPFSS